MGCSGLAEGLTEPAVCWSSLPVVSAGLGYPLFGLDLAWAFQVLGFSWAGLAVVWPY